MGPLSLTAAIVAGTFVAALSFDMGVNAQHVHVAFLHQPHISRVALTGHRGDARIAGGVVVALDEQAHAIDVGDRFVHLEASNAERHRALVGYRTGMDHRQCDCITAGVA